MTTQYSARIDDTTTLPSAVDNITPVSGKTVNNLRDAIIAIEVTLGVKPQSIYATVRARLDALEQVVSPGASGFAGGVAVSSFPLVGETIIWNGMSWTPTFPSSTPIGPAGGDLIGMYPDPTVAKLQGNSVSPGVLGNSEDGYVLTWVNIASQWEARSQQANGLTRNVKIVTSNYTIVSTDEVISVGVIGSTIVISLPGSPLVGETFDIKDGRGSAASHNIIVSGNGQMIDGTSNYIIAVNYECVTVCWDGGEWAIC